MYRIYALVLLWPLALALPLTPARAQSFNCRAARSADEVVICHNRRLANLDRQLAIAYAHLRELLPAAQRKRLAVDEAYWLRERRACGRNARCIAELYLSRIRALRVQAALPNRIDACVVTAITAIGDRFGKPIGARPSANSMGSAVGYANGGVQVSYDWVAALAHSRVGDRVRLCLASIPRGCPPGDDRGRVYRTTNLRTGKSWKLPDSEHTCGGA